MTLLHDNDRTDLEDGVRTMLHRLAADVSERPPAWDDLLAAPRRPRRAGARAVGLDHRGAQPPLRGPSAGPA